jgi:hypothetical protein
MQENCEQLLGRQVGQEFAGKLKWQSIFLFQLSLYKVLYLSDIAHTHLLAKKWCILSLISINHFVLMLPSFKIVKPIIKLIILKQSSLLIKSIVHAFIFHLRNVFINVGGEVFIVSQINIILTIWKSKHFLIIYSRYIYHLFSQRFSTIQTVHTLKLFKGQMFLGIFHIAWFFPHKFLFCILLVYRFVSWQYL